MTTDEFKQDEEETVVVFRRWPAKEGGDVIALFPEIDEGNYCCASYMHIGGHSGARYGLVINATRPATPEEYADLKAELEAYPYGYRLKVQRRYTRRRR